MRNVWLLLLFSLFGITACIQPPSPPTEQHHLITAKLDTTRLDFAPNWVPVQFTPSFTEAQSVSIVDEWPKPNDILEVECWTSGGEYFDPVSKQMETKWYKVLVPASKIGQGGDDRLPRTNEGAWGYMEAFWLVASQNVPLCS